MRRSVFGSRLAVFCGFGALVAFVFACGSSKSNPSGPTSPAWTTTGRVESIYAPERLLFLLGDSIVQAHVMDGATVAGYASLDDLYAAYRAGYQLQVRLTLTGSRPSWEGDANRVDVLHVSDPVAQHFSYGVLGLPNTWIDTVLLPVASSTFVVVDSSTVFRPDGDFASVDALKALKPNDQVCMDGDGFRLSDTDTRATTIRVWRSPDLYPTCKAQ